MIPSTHRRIYFVFAAALTALATLGAAAFPSDLLKKPDAWYATEADRQTTACVLSWQTQHSDWPKSKHTAKKGFGVACRVAVMAIVCLAVWNCSVPFAPNFSIFIAAFCDPLS